MKKLIMCKGLPASGKSTWAKEKVDANPGMYKRVNKDDLRAMVDNGKWSKANERLILGIRDHIVESSLDAGYHVIVDDTNFDSKHEKDLKVIADRCHAEFEIKLFDTQVDVCIERDAKRENPVGKKVIMDMYNKYLYKPWVRKPEVSGLPMCIICDIDGTLAEKGDRDIYDFAKCGLDTMIPEVVSVICSLYSGAISVKSNIDIIITTGRMDYCRTETENWLKDKIPFDQLYMRATDDTRKDSIVKQEIYDKYIKDKYNVLCVFDDRPQVVQMWRDNGLFVFDVNQSGKNF